MRFHRAWFLVPRDSQDLHKWEREESAFLAGGKASSRTQRGECASGSNEQTSLLKIFIVCLLCVRHREDTKDHTHEWSLSSRILQGSISETRTERPGERLRSEGGGGNWGCRKASALLAQIQVTKKMCAQDIILVKLQITFKTNIYKEDWQEECGGRGSSSASQSFWTTAMNLAKVERGYQGPSPDGF